MKINDNLFNYHLFMFIQYLCEEYYGCEDKLSYQSLPKLKKDLRVRELATGGSGFYLNIPKIPLLYSLTTWLI